MRVKTLKNNGLYDIEVIRPLNNGNAKIDSYKIPVQAQRRFAVLVSRGIKPRVNIYHRQPQNKHFDIIRLDW